MHCQRLQWYEKNKELVLMVRPRRPPIGPCGQNGTRRAMYLRPSIVSPVQPHQ